MITDRARQLLVVVTCDHYGARVSDALASFGFSADDLTDVMLTGLIITRKNRVYGTLAGQKFLSRYFKQIDIFEASPHI